MDYRRLGKSGLKVSEFSFGAWVTFGKQVGEDDAASIMGAAYDAGTSPRRHHHHRWVGFDPVAERPADGIPGQHPTVPAVGRLQTR